MENASRNPRRLISGSIFLLSLLIVVLAGKAAWEAAGRYQQARQITLTMAVVDGLIKASDLLAEERGLTSLTLGAGLQTGPPVPAQILHLRNKADKAWAQALRQTEQLAAGVPRGIKLRGVVKDAEVGFRKLKQARARADRFLQRVGEHISAEEWFAVATAHIQRTAQLRAALLPVIQLPPKFAPLNQYLKAWSWQASEHAGWERGTLVYYIAAQVPVPSPILDDLKVNWAITDKAVRTLIGYRDDPTVDARIRKTMASVETALRTELEPLRAAVRSAARTGEYPVNARTWWDRYTAAIGTILAVSASISEVTDSVVKKSMAGATWSLSLYIALMAAALGLATFSLTRVRRTANELFHQKELAQVTLHSIGDAVITADAEVRVEYLNPVAEELTGWTTKDAQGRPLSEVFRVINAQTRQPTDNPGELAIASGQVVYLPNNTLLIRRNGREVPIEDSGAPIRDREGQIIGGILVFYDVSERGGLHNQHLLSYQATHDNLTQLANRREFERRLLDLVQRARREGSEHALCYLDLDQFKLVNDTCGHAAGDNLLRHLGYLLRGKVRKNDTLARLGGDEFGVLLVDCPFERAVTIAQDLLQSIKEFRFVWEDKTFEIGASIGIIPVTAEAPSAEELLSKVDAACFLAKDKGRNRLQVYAPDDTELTRRHGEMYWVSRINTALKEERLVLDYQPIVALDGIETKRGEVLVRMLDESGNRVAPMDFIPAAERYDLMPAIDRWVIGTALSKMGKYLRSAAPDCGLQCHINLSGSTLGDDGLHAYIVEALREHAVAPEMVCFEITETAAVTNFEKVAELIKVLRVAGCYFALDDFGSGLSSFSYLKHLPVDYLKIDGNIVENIADDSVASSMVQAIHSIGQAMDIRTIAEYVSNDKVLAKLREIGVDFAQGFAVGRPQPIEQCLNT